MQFNLSDINPAALHVMWVLDGAGHEGRICGGAVRDLIMARDPKDWDIATTARPEAVITIMEKAGLQVVPTGLKHGTVTVVVGNENIEVTTLRVDVATDGRHAEVAFTEDWMTDSLRRDFTMNAMYLDVNLVVHDYHNGMADLHEGTIRFVGAPEDRIREDYLRILRYFRFCAKMAGNAKFRDDDLLYPIFRETAKGLEQISGERIWAEIGKILQMGTTPAWGQFNRMKRAGVLDHIGLSSVDSNLLIPIPDTRPAVMLTASFPKTQAGIGEAVALLRDRYKVSREELNPVLFAKRFFDTPPTRITSTQMLATHQKSDVLAWIAIMNRKEPVTTGPSSTGFNTLYRDIEGMAVPEFPITGQDLIDLGFTPGPEMGKILRQLRDVWAGVEFSASREYLINLAYQTMGHIK